MKKILFLLFLTLLSSNEVRSQTTAEKAGADATPAEPSPLQISIPHSERTKGNLLDSALDFIFVRFFKGFKDVDVDYGFFEIDAQRNLVFTNVSVKSRHPDAQGRVSAQKIVINFSDFMKALQSSKIETSQVIFEKISGDLNISERKKKAGENENNPVREKHRRLKFKAERLILKDVVWGFWGNLSDPVIGSVAGRNAVVVLSDPEEKYAASSAEVKGIKIKDGKEMTFSQATVDGKEYGDSKAFLQALKNNSQKK